MLDLKKHEIVLKNILKDIFTNPLLQANLAFKGGTCLYMFYGLERFSVDLDFNQLSNKVDYTLIMDIARKYLNDIQVIDKHFTWLCLGSYEKGLKKVKIEISKRKYPSEYINKNFYGLTVPVMAPSYMFAHKLCAILDRKKFQNRDIYDAHFMFTKGFDINEKIVLLRTGKDIKGYFKDLIKYIDKNINSSNVLNGLGDLLTEPQRNRTKETLKRDILFDLKSYI